MKITWPYLSVFLGIGFATTFFASPATAQTWTKCADENGVCQVSGTTQVRYGANGVYATKSATNSIACTNAVFGDPVFGVKKVCEFAAPAWVLCAKERETCSFSGTRVVRYGVSGKFFNKTASNSVACTNAVFGDPAVGVLKSCEYQSAVVAATPTPAPTATPRAPASTPTPVVSTPMPTPTPSTPAGTRDILKQPFASTSIWNMPIGSAAQYVPANMSASWSDPYASMPFPDEDVIILKPTAPLVDVRESTWDGNRCNVIGTRVFARVPIPTNFTNPSSNHNMASGILMPNGRTIVNVQPLTRCAVGGVATSIVRWPDSDIYGDGIDGAHGGSGMSSLGGTLRLGELRPGSQGPRHALKLTVFMGEGHKCTTFANCYRWPARTADGYALSRYGAARPGPVAFKMGALLALPPSINIGSLGLETEPGRQIAWTMQNYGGYVVDDSYGGQFGITTEVGPDGRFISQFKADYGIDFWQRTNGGSPWMRDIQRIVRALHIVDNNSAQSIGGGGNPRQSLLPAVAP